MKGRSGITLVELLIVISIIGILAVLSAPALWEFSGDYKVRSAATDLIQNMRLVRSLAIRSNEDYFFIFDTVNNRYNIRFDADNDGMLDTTWKTVELSSYGSNITFGTTATLPPVNPLVNPVSRCNSLNITNTVSFGPTGSAALDPENNGLIYIHNSLKGYSYAVCVTSLAGAINMWKWDSNQNQWMEVR